MKLSRRAGVWAVVVFTVLALPLIYQAFAERVPNDAGILLAVISYPTHLVLDPFYESLRGLVARVLGRSVDDRLAMEFDAITGWLLGCLQYGLASAFLGGLFRRRA